MTALDALRAAASELDAEAVPELLAEVAQRWRHPDSRWRARLAGSHPTFCPAMVHHGLVRSLESWTASTLRQLRERELRGRHVAPRVTAVWLAGSIPPAAFSALALPLLAGSAVYAKPSTADPISAALFAESLAELEPGLGACLRIGDGEDALEASDAVVASGSDASIRAIRARIPVATPFVGYAHKLSLGVVGPEVGLAQAARELAADLVLWDGRGCLSPGWVLVHDPEGATRGARTRELARRLLVELESLGAELPLAPLAADEQLQLQELSSRSVLRPDAELFAASDGSARVAYDPSGRPSPPGSLRFVWVVPAVDLPAVSAFCARLAPHLSTLGQAGWDAELESLTRVAGAAGASRVCPLGRMQLPPIDWRHDGMDPIRPLLRSIDVESP